MPPNQKTEKQIWLRGLHVGVWLRCYLGGALTVYSVSQRHGLSIESDGLCLGSCSLRRKFFLSGPSARRLCASDSHLEESGWYTDIVGRSELLRGFLL